jgi:hypothetical protein
MATATDVVGAVIPEQENRITLRDPIRESEGNFSQINLNELN